MATKEVTPAENAIPAVIDGQQRLAAERDGDAPERSAGRVGRASRTRPESTFRRAANEPSIGRGEWSVAVMFCVSVRASRVTAL